MVLAEKQNLKPITIVRADGTEETIYVRETPGEPVVSLRDKVTMTYFVIGIVALSLSTWLAIIQLNKVHNGK